MADTADLDYVHVVQRLGATVGDTPDDVDSNPDFVPVTEGTATIVPTSPEFRVMVNGAPVSAMNAPIVCTIDPQGYLSYNGVRGVWIVDLGSDKVTPPIPRDKAAYTVTYSGLKFGTQVFKKAPVSINPDSAALAGGDFNLTEATNLPLPSGVTLAYVQSIADEAVAAKDALLAQKGQPGGVAALGQDGKAQNADGTRPVGRDELVYLVDDHGVIGDGVTPGQQTAVNALLASIPDGSRVKFSSGKTYLIDGSFSVASKKNITLEGHGASIKMAATGAAYAAFTVDTSATGLTIDGFEVIGSRVVADGHAGFSLPSGTEIEDLIIRGCKIRDTMLGISLNANLAGHINGALVEGCLLSGMVGDLTGQGYGIHHASWDYDTPANVRLIGNTIEDCSRHAIYQARGTGVTIVGNTIRNHRNTVIGIGGAGTILPAIMVARSKDITVSANTVTHSAGGAIMAGGTGDGQHSGNITIVGNTFAGRADSAALVQIGQLNPSTDNATGPHGVVFQANLCDGAGSTTGTMIYLYSGFDVRLLGNTFRLEDTVGSTQTMLFIVGSDESTGTATYSDRVLVQSNHFLTSGTVAVAPIRLSGTEATAITMVFRDNTFVKAGSTGATIFALSANLSNPNVTISRQPTTGLTLAAGTNLKPEQMGDMSAGRFAANGATPQGKAANPGTATGTDAAVINAVIVALRNVGIVT